MYCMGENCLDGYGSMSVLPSRFIYIVILESQSCLALNFSLRIHTRPKETKMNRKKVQFQPRSQKYFKSCTQSVALGSFFDEPGSLVFLSFQASRSVFFFFFFSPKGLESPICRFFVWFSEVTFLIVQGHRLSDSTRKLTLCHTSHMLIPCILFCSGFPIVASPTRFWLEFSKIAEVSVLDLDVSASLGINRNRRHFASAKYLAPTSSPGLFP